jgi:hypothetical protein
LRIKKGTQILIFCNFQAIDTVDAAKTFIEENKIAVIGFFKVNLNLPVSEVIPLLKLMHGILNRNRLLKYQNNKFSQKIN